MQLVITTATASCSVALLDGDTLIAEGHDVVGRGHAERLIPMIAALPEGGRADAIFVDVGPGSFTGVRVGIAAARALALAWRVPLSGFSSLALIAAGSGSGMASIFGVAIPGGHGEYFVQRFGSSPLHPVDEPQSLPLVAAEALMKGLPVIGSASAMFGATQVDGGLPRASDFRHMPHELRRMEPSPLYLRAPDAVLP